MAGRVNGASARKSRNSIRAMPAKCRTSCDSYWLKELRFDQQVRDTYTQGPGNCLKGLESGRLFTLFQPHQCHPPDACCTGERILGQTGSVAEPPDALAQEYASPAWLWPQQPGDRMRHSSDGRSPRVSRPSRLASSSESSRTGWATQGWTGSHAFRSQEDRSRE